MVDVGGCERQLLVVDAAVSDTLAMTYSTSCCERATPDRQRTGGSSREGSFQFEKASWGSRNPSWTTEELVDREKCQKSHCIQIICGRFLYTLFLLIGTELPFNLLASESSWHCAEVWLE
jgi:hypothetical protein